METDIKNAVDTLKKGGIILYPTDTLWGLGCDATNSKAVQKIFKIKKRSKNTSFIVLVSKPSEIKKYVTEVPEILWDLIDSFDKPTTIIYANAKNLANNVIAKDGSAGIRVARDEFCNLLINKFGKPIVSTSANFTGDSPPLVFRDIPDQLKKMVDYVVESNRGLVNKAKASTIIKLKANGEFDVIRQ